MHRNMQKISSGQSGRVASGLSLPGVSERAADLSQGTQYPLSTRKPFSEKLRHPSAFPKLHTPEA